MPGVAVDDEHVDRRVVVAHVAAEGVARRQGVFAVVGAVRGLQLDGDRVPGCGEVRSRWSLVRGRPAARLGGDRVSGRIGALGALVRWCVGVLCIGAQTQRC